MKKDLLSVYDLDRSDFEMIFARAAKLKGMLKAGERRSPDVIEKELVGLVRDRIGPVAAFKLAVTVNRLPKTRSGKILRGTMKKIADHDPWTVPATIDDAGVLEEIEGVLKERGIA